MLSTKVKVKLDFNLQQEFLLPLFQERDRAKSKESVWIVQTGKSCEVAQDVYPIGRNESRKDFNISRSVAGRTGNDETFGNERLIETAC
jgi:hypothetical protein